MDSWYRGFQNDHSFFISNFSNRSPEGGVLFLRVSALSSSVFRALAPPCRAPLSHRQPQPPLPHPLRPPPRCPHTGGRPHRNSNPPDGLDIVRRSSVSVTSATSASCVLCYDSREALRVLPTTPTITSLDTVLYRPPFSTNQHFFRKRFFLFDLSHVTLACDGEHSESVNILYESAGF